MSLRSAAKAMNTRPCHKLQAQGNLADIFDSHASTLHATLHVGNLLLSKAICIGYQSRMSRLLLALSIVGAPLERGSKDHCLTKRHVLCLRSYFQGAVTALPVSLLHTQRFQRLDIPGRNTAVHHRHRGHVRRFGPLLKSIHPGECAALLTTATLKSIHWSRQLLSVGEECTVLPRYILCCLPRVLCACRLCGALVMMAVAFLR